MFLRTILPWQLWRFLCINLKMVCTGTLWRVPRHDPLSFTHPEMREIVANQRDSEKNLVKAV